MIPKVSMKAIDGKKIAIAGGGPGGLTLARLLQQSGAQVSVYERDQSRNARVQGSALDRADLGNVCCYVNEPNNLRVISDLADDGATP
jgi:predicted NAD/FAD-dependent oxidoreductase